MNKLPKKQRKALVDWISLCKEYVGQIDKVEVADNGEDLDVRLTGLNGGAGHVIIDPHGEVTHGQTGQRVVLQ